MAESMAYQFKSGSHIPKGVTPEGIMDERDRIEHDYGKVTIDNCVDAVLSHPEKYPNLRAFGPSDERDAMRRALADGIRYAYRVVTVVRTQPEERPEPRQIRVIHSVKDEDDDLVFKTLDVIRKSPDERKYLIGQLEKDATGFAAKMRDVLAEIAETL